jgi:hypothetical protein
MKFNSPLFTTSLHTFYDTLVKQYTQAAELTSKGEFLNVYRGRQHSISSVAEDLFANLLSDLITPLFADIRLYFMVDYAMRPDNTGSQMWPDIAIIIEDAAPMLVSYLDLKTDLGYKRNYHEHYPLISQQVKRMRAANFTGTKTYEKTDIQISKQIKWRTVVLSEANSTGTVTRNREEAQAHSEEFMLYFLARGIHPNFKKRSSILINEFEFASLLNDLQDDITAGIGEMNVAEINFLDRRAG